MKLLCLHCGMGPINWNDPDVESLDDDMTCQSCGRIYHGMNDWINQHTKQDNIKVNPITREAELIRAEDNGTIEWCLDMPPEKALQVIDDGEHSAADLILALDKIIELSEDIDRLRTCKTCGQDKIIAEIGARFGFRADVMAVHVRKLEEKLERYENALMKANMSICTHCGGIDQDCGMFHGKCRHS